MLLFLKLFISLNCISHSLLGLANEGNLFGIRIYLLSYSITILLNLHKFVSCAKPRYGTMYTSHAIENYCFCCDRMKINVAVSKTP